jgi:predicted cupin superfamily sugar epimerase
MIPKSGYRFSEKIMLNKEMPLTARDVIRLLDLKPHPEGGHFRETFRDAPPPFPPPQAGEGGEGVDRAASTAIYFLLAGGERSHWHRIDAVEVWHWYAGAALELEMSQAPARRERVILGNDLAAAERPQAIVPAHAWQAAQTLGEWTLVGCTVAPGFEFARFELAPKGWEPG